MNKEEKEYKSAVLQLQTALNFHNSNSLGEYNVNWKSVELILKYIKNLQKKAEQRDHYKHLYSEVKKQKDDAVDFIHKELDRFDCEGSMSISMRISYFEEELLRMLGEIDNE